MKCARSSRGYTLIELMVIVAIVGILAALASTFSTNWRRRNLHKRMAREVYNGLNLARATAIREGSKRYLQVDTTEGVFVFSDSNGNQSYDPDVDGLVHEYPKGSGPFSGEIMGQDTGSWPPGMAITTTLPGNVFVFNSQGFLFDTNNEPAAGSVSVADEQLGSTFTVDVTVAGALRIQ